MILQMEAVECGAAALGIVLAYHGRIVPLAALRRDCGVSRDGSKCSSVLKAAHAYGLEAKAYKRDMAALKNTPYPYIVFWNFNHFLVVEGYRKGRVYLNDPGTGPRSVPLEEFDRSYTGVMMTLKPGPRFTKGGAKPSIGASLWKRLRGSLAPVFAAVCAALLLVAPGLAIPALMATFVDRVLVQGLHDWGRPLVLGMLIAAVFRALLAAIEFRILRLLQIRLAVANSGRFVRHLLNLPASYYAQRYAGEVSSRIALNDNVAEVLSGRLATTSIDVLMMVFYASAMWILSHSLALVAMAFAAVDFAVMRWIARRRRESNIRLSMALGKAGGVGTAGLQSIRTLKASGLESDFFARWAGFFANLYNSDQELSAMNYSLGVLPPLLFALMTASVLIAGGLEVMNGRMSIGMLVGFQSLATSFLQPVNNLVALGESVQELAGHLSRLDDVLSSPAPAEPRFDSAPDIPVRLRGQVEFRNVTFGYNPVAPPLIADLSFSARPGQRIAFVGDSGSGKSTVVRLLAGLYTPDSGEILFDGIPSGRIPREILTNSMAMVDQEILLFEGTVRENLTLWDATTPDDSVARACRDAQIESAIDALPLGFASELLEGASNLSGGQRQRLEIARALCCDPSILVMDEATSALDSETELAVDRNIRARGCTCFIVAHRLSAVRDSDEILVLDRGRVVERGTHDELIRGNGRYARLLADDAEENVDETAGGVSAA
jgi:NHLM bacteriocin system ABC transporter peptidase/ATP-binding protein